MLWTKFLLDQSLIKADLTDKHEMPSPYGFKRMAVRLLDRSLYGRIIRGYEHTTGLRLVHHKTRCHNAAWYHKTGMWLLCDRDYLVARKFYYNSRRQKVGPLQWADRIAREYVAAGRPQPYRSPSEAIAAH